jgi:formylglycine-generating enzyme required for sulfatase activity
LRSGARPLPDYELVRQLGKGGFGEVWHARGPGGMDVALKFIKLTESGSAQELRALEMMRSIRHPNLVSLFGVWEHDKLLILAMELCDRTLRDRLKEAQARGLPGIPLKELLQYMRDAANGIDALNAKQVQHRDVKPLNLFLLANGVKVADFGLAKLLDQSLASHTGAMSPAYAAPEFMKGTVSAQSDQYCLAVTYCELRTGRLPFGGNIHQMMFGHAQLPPDLSGLDEGERVVVARALAKEPEKRWPNCKAFVSSLVASHQRPKRQSRSTANAGAPVPLLEAVAVTPDVPQQRAPAVSGLTEPLLPPRARNYWPWVGLAGTLLLALCSVCVVGGFQLVRLFPGGGKQEPITQTTTPPAGKDSRDKDAGGKQDGVPAWRDDPDAPLPETMTIDFGGSVKMDFVLIDPSAKPDKGVFKMGSPKTEGPRDPGRGPFDAERQHEVILTRLFYLARYPTTQEQYEKLIGMNPSHFAASGKGKEKVSGLENTGRHPVESVSWNDAADCCDRMTTKYGAQTPVRLRRQQFRFALPTEAQWEYACRAGTQRMYYFADTYKDIGKYIWYGENSGGRTHPVGEKENANAWGLCDLHGNVLQWCQDYYGPYDLPNPDPVRNVTQPGRSLRGGSWNYDYGGCRDAYRANYPGDGAYTDVGIRVAYRQD